MIVSAFKAKERANQVVDNDENFKNIMNGIYEKSGKGYFHDVIFINSNNANSFMVRLKELGYNLSSPFLYAGENRYRVELSWDNVSGTNDCNSYYDC